MSYHSLPSRDRAERHIHKRLNALAQELSISSDYVVYVLECGRDVLSGEREEWGKRFYKESEEYSRPKYLPPDADEDNPSEEDFERFFPGWFKDIKFSDSTYYVGYTTNLPRRLFAHIFPTEDAAKFTKMFEPNALVSVKEYDDHTKAKQREGQISATLHDFWLYHIRKDRMMRSIEGDDRDRAEERVLRDFKRSDEECMLELLLNQQIERLSNVGNLDRIQKIHQKIHHRHLKNCRKHCLDQHCYCNIDDIDERLNKVLDQLYEFYFGAFLHYRGMVRRMKSEQMYATYSR